MLTAEYQDRDRYYTRTAFSIDVRLKNILGKNERLI
jgi:hypothetical protein